MEGKAPGKSRDLTATDSRAFKQMEGGISTCQLVHHDAHLIDQRPAGAHSTPLRHKLHLFGAFLQIEQGILISHAVGCWVLHAWSLA